MPNLCAQVPMVRHKRHTLTARASRPTREVRRLATMIAAMAAPNQHRMRTEKPHDRQHAVRNGDWTLQFEESVRDGGPLHRAALDQPLLAANDVVKIWHSRRYEASPSRSFLSSARLEEKSLDRSFAR